MVRTSNKSVSKNENILRNNDSTIKRRYMKNGNYVIWLYVRNKPMTFRQFISRLDNKSFIDILSQSLIIDEDYFLETSKITNLNDNFIIILIPRDKDFRDLSVDWKPFMNRIEEQSKEKFIIFPDYSGEFYMIIANPYLVQNSNKFLTFRRFLLYATSNNIYRFFKTLKELLMVWGFPIHLKTHGLRVYYFHFRIQDTSSYYNSKRDEFNRLLDQY